MTTKAHPIVEEALSLPEGERAKVMEQLLETLSDEASELTYEQLADELERRRRAIADGDSKPPTSPR